MLDYIKKLITPDMVSLWVPSGQNRAQDLIRSNHGQCFGTHPNVPVISPPIEQINACDATTDWFGTSLSIDEADKKEGSGSLKDTIATPVATTLYSTTYNPTGSWDWSGKKHVLLWLLSDRANTAFTSTQLIIHDTSGNYRIWNLTFSAGEWTAIKKLLSTGDAQSATPPDLASINQIRVTFQAADTTAFYKKIDNVRLTAKSSLINPSVGWVFGGDDDYISVSEFALPEEYSFFAWASIGGNQVGMIFGHSSESGKIGYVLGNLFFVRAYNGGSSDSSLTFGNETWHFIGVTRNSANKVDAYFDGGSANRLFADAAQSGTLKIDRIGLDDAANWLSGRAALLGYSNKALSEAQFKNIHLATKGLFAPRG